VNIEMFGPVVTAVAAVGGTVLAILSIWYAWKADRLLHAIYKIVSRNERG
jgi:hypothetical protein